MIQDFQSSKVIKIIEITRKQKKTPLKMEKEIKLFMIKHLFLPRPAYQ